MCIQEFGRDEMVQIAIEEWAGASPVYTKRMQRALNYEGVDVPTIFKGLQLDIGAPPQFMDFRYTIHDRWHGEFHLDHCGALLDVEPMGDEYVFGTCHTIEDPTFDATAVATTTRERRCVPFTAHHGFRPAGIRIAHGRSSSTSLSSGREYPGARHRSRNPRSNLETRRDRSVRGRIGRLFGSASLRSRFRGVLAFGAGAHGRRGMPADAPAVSVLCDIAVRARAGSDTALADSIGTCQRSVWPGLAAERIHRALSLPTGIEGVIRVFELHPLLNPLGYVNAETSGQLRVHRSPAHDDAAWISLCSPESVQPLQAIATAVDPHIEVRASGNSSDWTAELSETDTATTELTEVSVAKVSGGSTFQFQPRRSLPLTVV